MKTFVPLIAAFLAFAGLPAFAAPAGEVTHLSGILTAKKADGSSKILSVKSAVEEGDVLNTEDDSFARIRFLDKGEVVLRPNTQLKVEAYRFDESKPQGDSVVLNMLKGGLRAVTGLIGQRNKEKVSYQTPTATIGIRGTHFGALFCVPGSCMGIPTPSGQTPAPGLHVDVATGAVSLTNAAGTFTFNQGQFAFVPNANSQAQLVDPKNAPRVVMPGAVAANRGSGGGIGDSGAADCVSD